MPTVTQTIGSAGGRTYGTLQGWATGLPASLVSDGNSYIGQCYADSEFVVTSGRAVTISGNTTDATHTITLTTAPGQSFRDNANAQTNALDYNPAHGVAVNATTSDSVYVTVNYVTVSNLQILAQGGTLGALVCGGGANNSYNNLIVKSTVGKAAYTTSNAFSWSNCVFITTNAASNAVGPNNGVLGYFCTFVTPSDVGNTAAAVALAGGPPNSTLENCAVFGFGGGVIASGGGTITYTNCMTDAAGPPTGVTGSRVYANQFVGITSAALDYRQKAGADLRGAGTADATHGATDIVGSARPQGTNWDIGCWEFVAVSGFARSLAESLGAADAQTRTAAAYRSLGESLGAADTETRNNAATRTLPEAESVADHLTLGTLRALGESLTASDALSRQLAAMRSLSETASALDHLVTGEAQAAPESAHPFDTLVAALHRAASLSDSVHLFETLAVMVPGTASLGESAHPAETLTASLHTARSLGESAHPADSLAAALHTARSLGESMHPADSLAAALHTARSLGESAHPADSLAVALHTARSLSETVAVGDRALKGTAISNERIAVADSLVVIRTGMGRSSMPWFPPQGVVPLPIEIITTGQDPGVDGRGPPTRANPLPIQVVPGAVPAVDTWHPPSWSSPWPVHQVVGAADRGGDATYYPPSTTYPLPCVLVTTGTDPKVDGWYPWSRAHPLPVVMV